MSNWFFVRVGLVVFGALSALFVPLTPQAAPPIGWGALAVIFLFCPGALLFVLGLQALNPASAEVWRRPSWQLNPFNFKEPVQFFHLAAYVFIAQGIVTLVRLAISSEPFYVEALVPIAIGVGVLIGISLSRRLFRSKVERAGA